MTRPRIENLTARRDGRVLQLGLLRAAWATRRAGWLAAVIVGVAGSIPAADPRPAPAGVVINEVMYHPPDDRDELQWVELWNAGSSPVDLTGWSFRRGLKFTFTNGPALSPGAFLVVSRDRVAFRRGYGTNVPVVGNFSGRLSHHGETIELADRAGAAVDTVKFGTDGGWPASPDGMSPSLERLTSSGPGDDPGNWAPSALPERKRAGGTPGQPNRGAVTNLPPVIAEVQFQAPPPGQPITVTARITDPDGVKEVRLAYRSLPIPGGPRAAAGGGATPGSSEIPMTAVRPGESLYTASIPAQPEGCVVRFRLRATDQAGSTRSSPHPDDIRSDWSVYVGRNTHDGRIPAVSLVEFGNREQPGGSRQNSFGPRNRGAQNSTDPTRGTASLVYFPTNGAAPVLYDFIRITPRQGGWKVRLRKDQPLEGMSIANVIFENQPRSVLAEHLAYELYRGAGSIAPLSGHWRVTYNGQPLGYFLYVEQPNNGFLRRNGLSTDGDLFKLLWYGGDLVGQHEKKNHPESGHGALIATMDALKRTSGAEQWKVIQERFDVDSFVNYYAVNLCLQNWDGFFNNYFIYRSPGPAGKWSIIPWDEDKTWGDYDGASPNYDWYEMPLTYGMNGARPPRSLTAVFNQGPFGGPQWWREPGFFSGPLLANPQFRARFLARLRELCQTTFTPQVMERPIAAMEYRLEPEIRFRASIYARARNDAHMQGYGGASEAAVSPGDVDGSLARFRRHIASFRNQVIHRREFLLRELGPAPSR